MKTEIKNNLENPKQLEQLYRENKAQFKAAFDALYPELPPTPLIQSWHERLHFVSPKKIVETNELLLVIALALFSGLIAKIPFFFGIDADYFVPRNISFIVFPSLCFYFLWKNSAAIKQYIICALLTGLCCIYINLLPATLALESTLILIEIHLPFILWGILSFGFTGGDVRDQLKRIHFIRYNGDLVILSTLLFIAGIVLSLLTVGLFNLVSKNIEEFYFEHIAVWGLVAIPLISTFLLKRNNQLVQNISPVLANLFTPLVFVMLVIYLITVIVAQKNPYNDREFLIVFNLLLVGVIAIIFFSLIESSRNTLNKLHTTLLFALSIVCLIVNGIALSAILFRISSWGFTPNRVAVLGANILLLIHLVQLTFQLYKALTNNSTVAKLQRCIVAYLPIYLIWTIIVCLAFPILFS